MKHLTVAGLLWLLCGLPMLGNWMILKQWTGTGAKETETFQTEAAEWRINWTNSGGGVLSIMVYDESGRLISLAANTTAAGKDTSYVHKKGRFYLKINATSNNWSASVQENH